MKIVTRIGAGYLILIVLMLAIQLYQVSLIHHMRLVNQQLARIDLRATEEALNVERDLAELEEFTQKFLALRDAQYGASLRQMRTDIQRGILNLSNLNLSQPEREQVDALMFTWDRLTEGLLLVEETYRTGDFSLVPEWNQTLMPLFGQADYHLNRIIEDSRRTVSERVTRSRRMSERAEWVSWGAAATAVVLSFLVCGLVVRSISGPFRQLIAATRNIAKGNFSYHVDEEGDEEISEVARNFNSMAKRLEELDELKKDFVSHVSHELKAPLASMVETTNLLLEEIPGELNEKQRRLLSLNLRSARRLSAMISNILDLSTLEAGAMNYDFEVTNLLPLLDRVLEEYEGLYREKNLCVERVYPSEPVPVRCDEERLIQVFGNLVANAVNFSPPEGAIRIQVDVCQKVPSSLPRWAGDSLRYLHQPMCIVSVIDQGPGVPDFHKERIFEKFHEVRQGKKLSGQGTGLGLTIARSIVQAHDGSLWVEDNETGGSSFRVGLPVAKAVRTESERRLMTG